LWSGIWLVAVLAIVFLDYLAPISAVLDIPPFSILTIGAFFIVIVLSWVLYNTQRQHTKKLEQIVTEVAKRDYNLLKKK
jgi:uncharacterized membrane protein YvlD (DUF360 family)